VVGAGHTNAAAFGAGATTTRANQQVFGTASNTYTMTGITSDASKTAQGTPSYLVTSNAGGDLAAYTVGQLGLATQGDISSLQGSVGRLSNKVEDNSEGVAISMAMDAPDLQQHETLAVKLNWGNFEGENALAFAGSLRLGAHTAIDAGIGLGAQEGNVGSRAGLRLGW